MIGEGICEVSDEKMQSLSKVLDEVEDTDFVDYTLMQADDSARFLPVLPFDTDKQSVHNVISSSSLAAFLNNQGTVNGVRRQFIIIDCRFPFEYQGGHIKGALNISSPDDLKP